MQVNYEFHEQLDARDRGRSIVEDYKSGARTARTISGAPWLMAMSEERASSRKRLHDRPDDSWTIDGALASGAYERAARGARARATRPTCRSR